MESKRRKKMFSLLATMLALIMVFSTVALGADEAESNLYSSITGKDGWYFLDADGSMMDYQGTRFFTDAELSNIKSSLLQEQLKLNSQGIEFVILLIPNKETIYPEFMPDEMGMPAAYTRIDQLYDCLKDDFRVVYPKEELIAAKYAYPQYDLYYRTDSHWNYIGGYIAARALARELGYELPDLATLSVTKEEYPGGDLKKGHGNLAGDVVNDYSYWISGYSPYNMTIKETGDMGYYVWGYTEGAPHRNLTVYGDSFSTAVVPFLSPFFENIYVHQVNTHTSYIDKEKSNVVVFEAAERLLDILK